MSEQIDGLVWTSLFWVILIVHVATCWLVFLITCVFCRSYILGPWRLQSHGVARSQWQRRYENTSCHLRRLMDETLSGKGASIQPHGNQAQEGTAALRRCPDAQNPGFSIEQLPPWLAVTTARAVSAPPGYLSYSF